MVGGTGVGGTGVGGTGVGGTGVGGTGVGGTGVGGTGTSQNIRKITGVSKTYLSSSFSYLELEELV